MGSLTSFSEFDIVCVLSVEIVTDPTPTPASPHRRFAPQLLPPRNCLEGRGVATAGEEFLGQLLCRCLNFSASRSPPLNGRGRGGVSNILSANLLSAVLSPWKKNTEKSVIRKKAFAFSRKAFAFSKKAFAFSKKAFFIIRLLRLKSQNFPLPNNIISYFWSYRRYFGI